VARLSNPGPEKELFGAKATRWLSTISSARELLKGVTEEIKPSLAELCSIVLKYSTYYYSADRPILQFESRNELLSLEGNSVLDTFIHTLLLGRISSRERLTKEDLKELLSMGPLVTFSQSKVPQHLDKICSAFEEGSRRRRLLVTDHGYIGSGVQGAEEGDLICVLFGCTVPVILRRLQDDESYEFIGECYLHGFMDAEAIALQIKGVLKERDFILV
jgi:hypothetical protein